MDLRPSVRGIRAKIQIDKNLHSHKSQWATFQLATMATTESNMAQALMGHTGMVDGLEIVLSLCGTSSLRTNPSAATFSKNCTLTSF